MQWLAALSVRRHVFATVLILSLTVIGIFSFTLLGVDRFPKVDIPTDTIGTMVVGLLGAAVHCARTTRPTLQPFSEGIHQERHSLKRAERSSTESIEVCSNRAHTFACQRPL